MHVRQQIVEDRVDSIATMLKIKPEMAFARHVWSIITGQSIHAFREADLVDGGQDKQLDIITIESDETEATVYVIQTKLTDSFQSNSLIQMHNGLTWFFAGSKAELATLNNVKLRDKIQEFRSLQLQLGPSNIHVVVAFVTNGMTDEIGLEFDQERRAIEYDYDGTYASFKLLVWGADELVNQINTLEKQGRRINATMKMRYDSNNPSIIKYYSEDLRGLICSVSAVEIARIVNTDDTGAVFDSNVRRFLGTRGAVNADILRTCIDSSCSHEFWFLNNGITIVCEHFDPITDPDNPVVKLDNMQIVNGCQTATTLAMAAREGNLVPDVRVLVRIYEAPSGDLVSRIVLTTNNQNKISSRDLRANDPAQEDLERLFKTYGYYYERKSRQYDNVPEADPSRIAPNEDVAQAYLAVVLRKPSDARSRKYKVWGDLYNQIFSGAEGEPYIIAWQIYCQAVAWLKASHLDEDADDVRRKSATLGTYFLARIAAYLWRGGDQFKVNRTRLQKQVAEIEANPALLDPYFGQAFELLVGLVRNKPEYTVDLDRTFKASSLDSEIDRVLHANQPSQIPEVGRAQESDVDTQPAAQLDLGL